MTPKRTILLVDDEPLERGSLSLMLEQEGYLVTTAENGLSAMEQLGKKRFDIVLSDLIMPGMTGMELLNQIKQGNVESEVILITAYGQIKDAVEAIQAGAYGFVEKSQNIDEELKLAIRRGLERLDLTRENRALRMALNDRNDFCQIIGQSRQMREIYDLIDTVAASKGGYSDNKIVKLTQRLHLQFQACSLLPERIPSPPARGPLHLVFLPYPWHLSNQDS